MEKIVTHHRSEGFALIGALALVAILSISAAPLLQRTAGVDKELLKQTSQKLVAINARESLETTVQLLRRNGIDPDFLNSVGSPASIRLANTCNRRIVAADPSLLNGQACPFRRDGSAATMRLLQVLARRILAGDPTLLRKSGSMPLRLNSWTVVSKLSRAFIATNF